MPQRGNGQTPIDPDRRLIPLRWPSETSVGGILRSRVVRGIILPLLAAVVLVKILMWTCLTYVAPNEFGIKVVRVALFGAPGVQNHVYGPGFHFVLKPLD